MCAVRIMWHVMLDFGLKVQKISKYSRINIYCVIMHIYCRSPPVEYQRYCT